MCEQEAGEIAAKERVQAWAEVEQVKATAQANRAPRSPAFRHTEQATEAVSKLRESQQQLSDSQSQLAQQRSQYQVNHSHQISSSLSFVVHNVILQVLCRLQLLYAGKDSKIVVKGECHCSE